MMFKFRKEWIQGIVCAAVFLLFRFSGFYGEEASAALYLVLAGHGFGIGTLLSYLGVTGFCSPNLYGLLTGAVPALGLFVFARILKKREAFRFLYLYAMELFLSFLRLIFIREIGDVTAYFLTLGVITLFTFCFYHAVACAARHAKRCNIEETVSLSVTAVYAMLCVQRYSLFGVPVFRMLGVFLVPAALVVLGRERALVFCVLAGCANAIYAKDPFFLGWYAGMGTVCLLFFHAGEWVLGCASLASELLLDVFFGVELTPYHLLFFAVAAVLFFLTVRLQKALHARLFENGKMRRVLLNRSRTELSFRLKEVSEVFRDMTALFTDMQGKEKSDKEIRALLVRECFERMCLPCAEGKSCFKEEARLCQALSDCMEKAISKGKVTLIDIPDFLNTRCRRLNGVMSLVNQMSVSYRQYRATNDHLDAGKQLLATQFEGVSHIFENLAGEIRCHVSSDSAVEERFREQFLRAGIACGETLVFEGQKEACAIVDGSPDPALLSKVATRFFGKKFLTGTIEPMPGGGTFARFTEAPASDVVFGSAKRVKHSSTQSGDVHTLVRISDSKFLVALCDGMGSGERARKVSSASVSLVENLYRAGFSSDFILRTVNKLLVTCFEECLTTLDIAVFDLDRSVCDFIKVGSADSYIKGKESARRISCASMPLGILDEIRPATSSESLTDGELVVLSSDGVTDSFPDRDAMLEFLASLNTTNPQECADLILEAAVSNDGGTPKDDMTVLVMRIFSRPGMRTEPLRPAALRQKTAPVRTNR